MEQKFSNNSIDLQVLREFCEREGEAMALPTMPTTAPSSAPLLQTAEHGT